MIDIPTFHDIQLAHQRIAAHIHRTPVLTSTGINAITGADIFFKCENFQKVGAFKYRGATNAVLSLAENEATKGVATHSSGNHAAGSLGIALVTTQRRQDLSATVWREQFSKGDHGGG